MLSRHLVQQRNHGQGGGRAWRHRPPRTPARLNCVHLTTSCDLHSPAVDGRVRTGARGRSGSAPNLAASSPHWGAVSKRLLSPGLFLTHAIMGLSLRDVLHPQAPQPGPAGRRTPKPLTLMKGHRGVGWAETAGSVRFPGKWHVNPWGEVAAPRGSTLAEMPSFGNIRAQQLQSLVAVVLLCPPKLTAVEGPGGQGPEPRSAGLCPPATQCCCSRGSGGALEPSPFGRHPACSPRALRPHALSGRPAVMRRTGGPGPRTGCSSLPAPAAHPWHLQAVP